MINVNDNFKIDIRTYGRQFDVQLKANNTDISSDDLNYLKPSFNTSLFKTVMHQIEIDSKLYMPADTKITGKIGVKVNEKTYNYINLNNCYVKSCERQEDTNSYRILAYTKMKESMIDYDLTLTEKITVRNYLIKICQRLGWNTSNIPATFINSEKLVDPSLHTGINYSFRDALDELATITCSFFMFKGDEFYLLYLTETNESIDETYLDEDNITIGEKYIINSLVFSRAEESDNIFRKDDTSIATNGLHEYRISDCQLLSTNDRSDYIDEMFNYLRTLEFYIFDIQSKGILFLEACDLFNLKLNNVTYKVALLNDEINIEDGLTENLFLDKPEETETEYKYADSTDKKINQAYILVDKQNKKITQLAEETTENSEKITQQEQTVEGITQKVSSVEKSVENITNTEGEATGKNIHLEDSSDEELVSIKVKGETNQATRSGKNKFNIFDEDWRIYNGIKQSDGSIKANVNGQYYISLQNTSDYWKNYIMQSKGKTLTFSQKEVINSYSLSIVIYGERTSTTSGYQAIEGSPSTRSTSLTIADDFTSVSRIELRTLRKQPVTTFTDTTTVITELQLEEGLVATDSEEYGASPSPDYPSEIENVEGRNKFNINGEFTDLSGGKFLTKIEGNKIIIPNIEGNGSSALFDYIEVEENTDINISFNLLQGTARIGLRLYDKNKNIINNSTISLPKFTYNQYYQGYWCNGSNVSTTIPEGVKYIRYLTIGVQGTKENIYENFQIEKGNSKKPYVPYNSLEIKDVGENLADIEDGNTTRLRAFDITDILKKGQTYSFSSFLDLTNNTTSARARIRIDLYSGKTVVYKGGNAIASTEKGISKVENVTITNDITKVWFNIQALDINTFNCDYSNVQIKEGSTTTPYTPYQEQKVTFPLGNQKLMEGSYLASDGIHNKRTQVVLTGNEDWTLTSTSNQIITKRFIFRISPPTMKMNSQENALCSHFANVNDATEDIESIYYAALDTTTYIALRLSVNKVTTLEQFKAYLAEQYSKGTPVTVEYELEQEEIVPYTAEQQEAWEKIEQLHTYKNITNIFSNAELDIVYVRDNGLSDMYETKQNANKNYTKTIKKIAEQKITTDEITQKVSSLEETTVKKIQVQYALSDSEIIAPTGAWSTTAPEWQTGKYMWQKTVTIYSNGTTIESEPTCIQGAKGETGTSGANGKDGKDGEKGKGVKSIQDQYYLSTSNTTQTGGNWKNTQDSWESGKYIWTRSHITWSDDTTTNTTPILAQGLNKANETANNTKENLENNYSTTVEMNAAISTKADEITSEVNKKVNEVDLGTKIEQNYEHVKLAWNQISEFIQLMILNKNASLAILDKNQKVMMALDKEGQHFYETDGNTIFGDMGVQKEDDKQYIAFSVLSEYAQKISNGMAWGIKTKSDNIFHPIFYIKNFEMSDKNSDSSYGELVLNSCNMILEGLSTGIISGNIKMYGDIANNSIQFINTDTEDILLSISASDLETGYPKLKILNNISFFQNEGGANSFKLGNGDNSCLLTDDGEIMAKTISADNIVNSEDIYNISGAANSFLYANFRGGGSVYLYTTSSDKELKKNIKKTNVNAIELIQRIKHREFDWKKNNQHQKIGYVAQEMQKIDENFVYHTKFKAENGEIKEDWQINVLSVLATATKAIQEQQKQIEKMQKEIDELKSKEV